MYKITYSFFLISYSHGELHNLQEFEQGEMTDDNFDGYENDPTLHSNLETVDKSIPSTTSRSLLKTRLSGHGQSLDDDTISYYNRYVFIDDKKG